MRNLLALHGTAAGTEPFFLKTFFAALAVQFLFEFEHWASKTAPERCQGSTKSASLAARPKQWPCKHRFETKTALKEIQTHLMHLLRTSQTV